MSGKYLVIVESPAKAKTIEKYLGSNYKVMASYGHVRDLVPKEGAVDPEHDFLMKYQAIERNIKHVEAIAKALKSRDGLLLAPDPDREGEAIAWHVNALLEEKGALKNKTIARVVFHQITQRAIQDAIAHPRDIAMDLVNAQQARRALDYLVGFNLSPLLWRKIRPGLSAGRVQSPALRMIVEREEEIEKFISQEYWTIEADVKAKKQGFLAKLIQFQGKKIEQFSVTDATTATAMCEQLTQAANGKLLVSKVIKKERKRHPAPPFITSTLQQEAARKLGFSAQRTMTIAQQLYEGIDISDGPVGLITYMRTDSTTLAKEAVEEIRECIKERYGAENLPEAERIYKTKSKNAQEAHEAVRPTSVFRYPDDIKGYLSADQYKLYSLIWKRTMACQMIDATLHTVAVDLTVADHIFRATGSSIVDPGFITVYQEDIDEPRKEDDEGNLLPVMEENTFVDVKEIKGEQHFTEPPPRYTEASLVKALEEHGIGRPSTYASIIATLKHRDYVEMQGKRFKPTDVARVVSHFLTQYFTNYVDYDFTAKLEDQLDEISRGDKAWVPVLKDFWQPFQQLVAYTRDNVKRSDVTQEKISEKCPQCGGQLAIRLGKRGRFIGCTAYPDCNYTRSLDAEQNSPAAEENLERKCPDCQADLVVRHGKYGKFIGCSRYPECKHIEPLEAPEDTQVACPKCKKSTLLKRKSRRGKIFFSCKAYPKCDYAIWNQPIAGPCPKCAWPILTIKTTKRKGTEKACPQKNCDFLEAYIEEGEKDE